MAERALESEIVPEWVQVKGSRSIRSRMYDRVATTGLNLSVQPFAKNGMVPDIPGVEVDPAPIRRTDPVLEPETWRIEGT